LTGIALANFVALLPSIIPTSSVGCLAVAS